MRHIYVYIPEAHLDAVKQAMFAAGGGRFPHYDQVCWQTKGLGQFHPLETSNPYVGKPGRLETVVEYKLEMICEDTFVTAVIEAMSNAHPYETPAYGILQLQ